MLTTAEADKIAYESKIQRDIAMSMRTLNIRPQPFSPAPVSQVAKQTIARFAAKGINISITKNNALRISPAGQLNPDEREFLTRHKDEIVEYLQSHEVL